MKVFSSASFPALFMCDPSDLTTHSVNRTPDIELCLYVSLRLNPLEFFVISDKK